MSSFRWAVAVHFSVLAIAFFALPIGIARGFGQPPIDGESIWLIRLFALSVGAPFFAVAGNAPLMQVWFVRTSHPAAGNPYFLYSASNLGSFVSLLAYPLLVEPNLTLKEQSQVWSSGFVALAALIAVCALLVPKAGWAWETGGSPIAASKSAPRRRGQARVDVAVVRSLCAACGGDRPNRHRRRLRAVPLDHPAGAISGNLCSCVSGSRGRAAVVVVEPQPRLLPESRSFRCSRAGFPSRSRWSCIC